MRFVRSFLATSSLTVCAAVALVQGCGLDAVGSSPSMPETGILETVGIDSSVDAAVDVDVPFEAGPDGGCAASCVAVPSDWTLLANVNAGPTAGSQLVPGAPAGFGCPAGWTGAARVAEGATAGTTCGCSCGGSATNPCTTGTADGSRRTNGGGPCNDGTTTLNVNGGCNALSAALTFDGFQLSPEPVARVGCPQVTARPPLVAAAQPGVCTLLPPQATCPNAGEICTPPAGAAGKVCVVRDGDQMCPSGFANKKLVVPANGVADTRVCGNCGCGSDATSCSNHQIRFYSNALCTLDERIIAATNACNGVASGTSTHYRYTATPNVTTCTPAMATVGTSGNVTLPPVRTLCCQ